MVRWGKFDDSEDIEISSRKLLFSGINRHIGVLDRATVRERQGASCIERGGGA